VQSRAQDTEAREWGVGIDADDNICPRGHVEVEIGGCLCLCRILYQPYILVCSLPEKEYELLTSLGNVFSWNDLMVPESHA